jgi:hypothetical protein
MLSRLPPPFSTWDTLVSRTAARRGAIERGALRNHFHRFLEDPTLVSRRAENQLGSLMLDRIERGLRRRR